MARNKNPEETVNKIIEASLKLFIEKGYESTSIQDIINELGGLTKGAIYHHFKSKDEIFVAVAHYIYKDIEAHLTIIRNDPTMTGRQKLKALFHSSIESSAQDEMFAIAPHLLENPPFLALQMKNAVEEVAPLFIQPVLEQGIADGSIQTDSPKELAEILMLLSNIWLNPMIFVATPTEMLSRCRFFQKLLLALGLDIIDDKMLERIQHYAALYELKHTKS